MLPTRVLRQWALRARVISPEKGALRGALFLGLKAASSVPGPGYSPVDNHQVENQILPLTLGRSNWLHAGSLRSG
jgi:hypothetical protein